MSYVVHFWKAPLPTSVVDAAAIHSELSEQSCKQVPEFIELARKLTNRYPCITTLDDEDGAWTDGPLDGINDEPVYGIGINLHMLETVLPFVRKCAMAAGLVTFDEQAGEVVLPDGTVLTMPGHAPIDMTERPSSGELTTPRAVNALLAGSLTSLLESFGFKSDGGSGMNFNKPFESHPYLLFQSAAFVVQGHEGNFSVRLHPYSQLDWRRVFGNGFDAQNAKAGHCEIDVRRALTVAHKVDATALSLADSLDRKVTSQKDVQWLAEEFRLVLTSIILPTFKLCEELSSFDSLVNSPQPDSSVIAFSNVNLIVAFLTGNQRYREIVQREASAAERRYDYAALTAIETLDAYLTLDLSMTLEKIFFDAQVRSQFAVASIHVDGPDRVYRFNSNAGNGDTSQPCLIVVWTRRSASGEFEKPPCLSPRRGVMTTAAERTQDEKYLVHVAHNFLTHPPIDVAEEARRIVRRYDLAFCK